ncbi:MAG TPA: radical SAM family heme chaperone HemW [Thermoanaerobaculia bacterium]|nr:radical SAM family heme chaperone HemW [Thermoanaerobaculia bacterium]
MNAGLYVHLPYCASRCGYCAFAVTTDGSTRGAYLDALAREIDLVAAEARDQRFDTVYLGGGTPSLLPPSDIAGLLDRIRGAFDVAAGSEVTLEANPEDVTAARRDAWMAAGVTRVSVGVQSLSDRELAAVGRRHDAARAREALALLAGRVPSLSGDLILGLPEQTAGSFRASARALAESGVDHVSVYLLEADKSKALEEDRREHPERYPDDDAQAALWLELSEELRRRGFEHYEISNWARPGRASRHNRKYWERTPTLGLGLSAHELWRERRRANVASLPAYLERLGTGERPVALDREVGAEERESERIVLGLRLVDGVARDEVESWIARRGDARLREDWEAWREAGLLRQTADRVALTERGGLVSNDILCRFL